MAEVLDGHAPETLEERVSRLEELAFEGDALAAAVTRLGLNASALGEALLTVDKNAQRLTRLGRDLEAKADKTEVLSTVATVEQELACQRRARLRIAAIGSVVVAVLFGLVLFVSNSAYKACTNRQAASMAVRDTLLDFRTAANAPIVDAGVRRIDATLAEPCGQQYPLHLP